MIILHFDLQPQFKYMNYFIYTSLHFTPHGRYELNRLASLPMCGFIAQLVEHRTGVGEVTGSNPVWSLDFFRLLLSNCLNWKIYCDDHSSLWSTTAVQIYELFNIYFTSDQFMSSKISTVVNETTLREKYLWIARLTVSRWVSQAKVPSWSSVFVVQSSGRANQNSSYFTVDQLLGIEK